MAVHCHRRLAYKSTKSPQDSDLNAQALRFISPLLSISIWGYSLTMAEVLGITAAVIQFLDIGLRLTLKIHSFSSEVRDVPRKLSVLKDHVIQHVEMASSIQTSISNSSFGLNSSSEAQLNAILDDQRRQMEILLQLLDSITNNDDDGLFRRGWNGIKAIDKKKDIESACDQIEAKGDLISLWLVNTNA